MLPIKTFVIGGAIASIAIAFIFNNIHSAAAQKPQPSTSSSVCKTWQDVKSEIQMIYMETINTSQKNPKQMCI
jgi:hypothetical protein